MGYTTLKGAIMNSPHNTSGQTEKTEKPVTPEREAKIRADVRAQILSHLERDLEGDEQLMKEVWEGCDNKEEHEIAKDGLRVIIALVKGAKKP